MFSLVGGIISSYFIRYTEGHVMKLGQNIAIYRKEAGLTQEQLAEKCEVSRQAVTKWEKRRSKIKSCILPLYLYGNNDFMGRR